ncbi:CBS domain-containing protein [Falsiroseomonas tokyonensis]|uniref:CBS domain-containing protein n=1 Tax=Falsiroseomonas tokyonensis TaxID=430521 RepID=A0ABV7BMY5_9PROT|nr:CBS domain-containing protein [Falsiroseomonas tokyonensis]
MTRLSARDLMTAEVVTVPPATPVLSIARLLADRGISAVPVLDGTGRVLGIVTEADLIRRLAGEADHPASWLASLFANAERDAARYARAHGVTAADVMTTELVSVGPTTPAAEVAQMMEERSIRRVLVLEGGKLLGIVSRADLLRALVAPQNEALELSDDRVRGAVMAAMRKQPWADTFYTLIDVKDGVVELNGFSRSAEVQRALRVLAENVPGVKGVKDKTTPMPAYLYTAV